MMSGDAFILSQASGVSDAAIAALATRAFISGVLLAATIKALYIWFWSFISGPFLGKEDPPDLRAFKNVTLAALLVFIVGLQTSGPLGLFVWLGAVPVYYYRRWRYRRAWIDTDLRDTFQ